MIVPLLGEAVSVEADFMNVLPGISLDVRNGDNLSFTTYHINPYFIQIRIDSTLAERSDMKRTASSTAKARNQPENLKEPQYRHTGLESGNPQNFRVDPKPQRRQQYESEVLSDSNEFQSQHMRISGERNEKPPSPSFFRDESPHRKATRPLPDQTRLDIEEHQRLLRDADALINSSADYLPERKEYEPHQRKRPLQEHLPSRENRYDHTRGTHSKSRDTPLEENSRPMAFSESVDEPWSKTKQPPNSHANNRSRKFEERFREKSPYLKVQPDYKNPGGSSTMKATGHAPEWKENTRVTTKKKSEKRSMMLGDFSPDSPSRKYAKY